MEIFFPNCLVRIYATYKGLVHVVKPSNQEVKPEIVGAPQLMNDCMYLQVVGLQDRDAVYPHSQ